MASPGMSTTAADRVVAPLWLPLDGEGAPASLVGGKAAALDRLIGASAPVPRAVALTVDAYRSFVEAAALGPLLATLSSVEDEQGMASRAEELADAFVSRSLPPPVRDAICRAYDQVSGGGAVAVRSSALAEDSASASFAGQYRSLLDVDAGGVEQAVRLCWASLWTPHARVYRRAKGLAGADVAMGVVVQAMIAAEWSGVAFTVDPTTVDSNVMRVELVEGLGEGLVSGQLTPDVFHLRRDTLTAVEADAPSFLQELGRCALEIEHDQGHPQDVEWSVAAGRLYVLQARPITAGSPPDGDGFDTHPIPGVQFTPAGIEEMLPGVLSPLLWTSNAPMLEDAFASLFGRLGIRLPAHGEPMLGRFRGRAALNLSRLKAAARQMPRGAGAEVERQYVGRVVTNDVGEAKPTLRLRLRRARSAALALGLRKRLPGDSEVFLAAARLALTLQPDLQGAPTAALVSYRRRVRELA
ncbi:MAG: PEP/pyruvate-binding domain-containing protein, partial [Acidimicrobiales bacterium]